MNNWISPWCCHGCAAWFLLICHKHNILQLGPIPSDIISFYKRVPCPKYFQTDFQDKLTLKVVVNYAGDNWKWFNFVDTIIIYFRHVNVAWFESQSRYPQDCMISMLPFRYLSYTASAARPITWTLMGHSRLLNLPKKETMLMFTWKYHLCFDI